MKLRIFKASVDVARIALVLQPGKLKLSLLPEGFALVASSYNYRMCFSPFLYLRSISVDKLASLGTIHDFWHFTSVQRVFFLQNSSSTAYYKNNDLLNLFACTDTVDKTNIFESIQLDLPPLPSVLSVLL